MLHLVSVAGGCRILSGNPGGALPPGFPIQLNEASQSVTVAAGVPLRILLDYLSSYRRGLTYPLYFWHTTTLS